MDPTAPNDNDQNQEGNENQTQSPVQTGGFVVSGEAGIAPNSNQTPHQAPPDPQAPQPVPNAPNSPPEPTVLPPSVGELQSDLQSTVEAATGTNLAGKSDPIPQSQDTLPPLGDVLSPATREQPDPTPFTPAQSPMGAGPLPGPVGAQQQQEASAPEGDSNSGKMKSLIIVIAVFILVAILAAVAWYFVLNKGQTNEDTTSVAPPIELPSSPSPRTDGGFGNLPEPTPEATAPADLEEGNPEEDLP